MTCAIPLGPYLGFPSAGQIHFISCNFLDVFASNRLAKEITVASVCEVCGKGPGFGKQVSHSHVRTNRRWNPNIQRVRALVNGAPKRLNVCTSCLKAGKVTRNI